MLQCSAVGFGNLALASLLHDEASASSGSHAVDPLAARAPHFAATAKRVIFLFMTGGPSQVDTFDPKPLLERDDGKPLPFDKPRVQFAPTGNLLKSPWKFEKHGASGIEVSSLFPCTAQCVDDICFIHSLHGTNAAHGGALLKLHTGSESFVRPSMGSWITYGLGTESRNLPGFITICPTLAHGGVNNWSSAFLPAAYQGTPLGNASIPADQARVRYIENSRIPRDIQRLQLDALAEANRAHLARFGPNQALEGRIDSFELAFRMQTSMPEIESIADES
jgi:hypothetical protein